MQYRTSRFDHCCRCFSFNDGQGARISHGQPRKVGCVYPVSGRILVHVYTKDLIIVSGRLCPEVP